MQTGDLALEHAEIVRDEGQRVVDLVRNPGRGLAQAGHPRLLEHPGLRLLQFEVGLLERLVGELRLVERRGELAIGPAQLPGALRDLDLQQVVGLLQLGFGSFDLAADAAAIRSQITPNKTIAAAASAAEEIAADDDPAVVVTR